MHPFIPVIVTLVVLVALNSIPRYGYLVTNVLLLVFFMFIGANLVERTGTFYSIMALANIIFSLFKLGPEKEPGESPVRGLPVKLFSIGFGISLFLLMFLFQSRARTAVIGVPSLLAVSGLSAVIGSSMIGALGFIENRFVFNLFEVFRQFVFPFLVPLAGPFLMPFAALLLIVLPVFTAAFVFAFFHLSAFSLAVSSLIFAFLIMVIWIGSYLVFDDEPSSIAHYLWNSVLDVGRHVSLAGVPMLNVLGGLT